MHRKEGDVNVLDRILRQRPKLIAKELRKFSLDMLSDRCKEGDRETTNSNLLASELDNAYRAIVNKSNPPDPKVKESINKKLIKACLICLKTGDWNSANLIFSIVGFNALKEYKDKNPLVATLLLPITGGVPGNRQLLNYFLENKDKQPPIIPSIMTINNIFATNYETTDNFKDKLAKVRAGELVTDEYTAEEQIESFEFTLGKTRSDSQAVHNMMRSLHDSLDANPHTPSELYQDLSDRVETKKQDFNNKVDELIEIIQSLPEEIRNSLENAEIKINSVNNCSACIDVLNNFKDNYSVDIEEKIKAALTLAEALSDNFEHPEYDSLFKLRERGIAARDEAADEIENEEDVSSDYDMNEEQEQSVDDSSDYSIEAEAPAPSQPVELEMPQKHRLERTSHFQKNCIAQLQEAYAKIIAGDPVIIKQNGNIIFDSSNGASTKEIGDEWLKEQIGNLRDFINFFKDSNYTKISLNMQKFQLSEIDKVDLLERLHQQDQKTTPQNIIKAAIKPINDAVEAFHSALAEAKKFESSDSSEAANIARADIISAFESLQAVCREAEGKRVEYQEGGLATSALDESVENAGRIINDNEGKVSRLQKALEKHAGLKQEPEKPEEQVTSRLSQ